VKRQLATTVSAVAARTLTAGGPGATTCVGDSGGAALDDGGALVGIVSAGDDACATPSQLVRPDSEPQLAQVIAAWSGPCPADGTCAMGCADPDCDPCGFNGTCATACPAVDLDCSLGAGPGETCLVDTDCESRACTDAPEGYYRFCTAACTTDSGCPAPLDFCTTDECFYRDGTPGLPGASCTADATCRSNLCDLVGGACTVPCGDGNTCPAELLCEPVRDTQACVYVAGCADCSSAGSPPLWLAIAFVLRRRRRGLQSSRRC
jgi:hypothetical protein